MNRTSTIRAGFTLIELMAVVLILAILAGVALPRFFDYQDQARVAAVKGTLGGVRSGIANFYANGALMGGSAVYPTLTELTALGTVMQEAIPDNPYPGTSDPGAVVDQPTFVDAGNGVTIGVVAGWCYFEGTNGGDPSVFYANTSVAGENTF